MAEQKFDILKMKPNETISQLEQRFTTIMIEINSIEKEYTKKKVVLKVMRALPGKWRAKRAIIKDTKDISNISARQLFYDL